MTMRLLLLQLVLVWMLAGFTVCQLNINSMEDNLINERNNMLGYEILQDKITQEKIRLAKVNARDTFNLVYDDITEKFNFTYIAVNHLVATIEAEYESQAFSNQSLEYKQCCEFQPGKGYSTESYRFKQWVNLIALCYRYPHLKHNGEILTISPKMLKAAQENDRLKDYITWQYYGTKSGVSVQYPDSQSMKCDDYDPRIRPWYTRMVSPKPKDILIMIDRSKYSGNGFEYAVRATIVAIDNMSPFDRFGLILFAQTPNLAIGCYQRTMSVATELNKKNIKKILETKVSDESPNFEKAFSRAFEVLTSTVDVTPRNKVILLISSGKTTLHTPIHKKIREANKLVNNSVIILTYGVSKDNNTVIPSYDQQLLKDIANQTFSDPAYGRIRRGTYEELRIDDGLELQFYTYYKHLTSNYAPQTTNTTTSTKTHTSGITISTPYEDYSKTGNIISAAKIVKFNNEFMGVVGVDLKMVELLNKAVYLNAGSRSYAFIVDSSGRTLLHPLMTSIQGDHSTPASEFVDIENFEFDDKLKSVIQAMKKGKSGSHSVTRKQAISLGDPKRQGVRQETIQAEYIYGKIKGTDLSLCVVVAVDSRVVAQESTAAPSKNFHYHRLDLLPSDKPKPVMCALQNDHIGSLDYSVIKLTGYAFKKPMKYFNEPERKMVDNYYAFFTNREIFLHNIRPGVKQMIVLSDDLDDTWRKAYFAGGVFWIYVAFVNGVFRQYPAEIISKEYDPTQRSWYKSALAYPDKIVFTPPYYDFGNDVTVTTMSISLSHDGLNIGVMGIDFSLNKLEKLVLDANPKCKLEENSCFLVDLSGNIVYHNSFMVGNNDIRYVHIAEKEPEMTRDLIKSGFLVSLTSIDFNTRKRFYTWEMKFTTAVDRLSSTGVKYRLERIAGTACYLGVVKTSSRSSKVQPCHSIPVNRIQVEQCTGVIKPGDCFSPCYELLIKMYNACANTFTSAIVTSKVSLPSEPVLNNKRPYKNENIEVSKLKAANKFCIPVFCENFSKKEKCLKSDCAWCMNSNVGHEQCRTKEMCHIVNPPSSSSVGKIVGIVGGVLVLLVVCAVLAYVFFKRRAPSQSRIDADKANKQRQTGQSNLPRNNDVKTFYTEEEYEDMPIPKNATINDAYYLSDNPAYRRDHSDVESATYNKLGERVNSHNYDQLDLNATAGAGGDLDPFASTADHAHYPPSASPALPANPTASHQSPQHRSPSYQDNDNAEYDSLGESSVEGDGDEVRGGGQPLKLYIPPVQDAPPSHQNVAYELPSSTPAPELPSVAPPPASAATSALPRSTGDQPSPRLDAPPTDHAHRVSPLPSASDADPAGEQAASGASEVNELYKMFKDVQRTQPNFDGYHNMSG